MSGHSHFATIKRQKAANDAVKGNLFSKMARGIMLAAKGGADPDMNFKLRVEIDKAKAASMPKENIERAIAKATTNEANLDEITYEGFGPNGLNVVVEVATNNKNRTAQEIKSIFEKSGGSMGGPGAVMFNFVSLGFLFVKKSTNPEEDMLKLIDAGVEDVNETEDGIEVYVAPEHLGDTRKKLQELEFEVVETELQLKAKNTIAIETPDWEEKVTKFLDSLEENDDVQKVFTNLE